MMRWTWRVRYGLLTLSAGGLWAFNGCGLSDQQWATIWQSVLTTALNTIVSGALSQAG
ncbi:MAG: hypothetical protein AB1601_01010 [Planctomycetota bacterium]